MQILYINYTKSDSGGIVHTSEFVKAGNKLGHDIILYPPFNHRIRQKTLPVEQSTMQEDTQKATSSLPLPFTKRIHLFFEQHFFDLLYFKTVILKGLCINSITEYKTIKKTNPDVVILRAGTYLGSLLGCKLLNIPCLIEVNGPLAENRYNKSSGYLRFEKAWSWLFEEKLIKLAGKIIVVSEPFRYYYIKKGLKSSRVVTVPNGVDTRRFFPHHPRKNEILDKYQLTGMKIIGFTGNFRPWHGLESLLKLMPQIVETIQNVKLLIVGDGPEKKLLIRKTHELGIEKHITFTGRVSHEDMPAILSVFDVAVAPYAYTDFFYFSPLKIFEYMATGCGIIAPELGQINELIEDDVSGILYDPRTPDGLVDSVCRLLANDMLRKNMGKAARRRAMHKFTWQHNAKRVIRLCEQTIAQK